MAKVEKIPIELDLRTAKALRDALGLEKTVGRVGDEADEAGKKGSAAFEGFSTSALGTVAGLVGVTASISGMVSLLKDFANLQETINKQNAETIRQAQGQQKMAAEILRSPELQKLRQLVGGTLQERFQEASERAAQFGGLDVMQTVRAQLNMIPRLSEQEIAADPGARRSLDTALTFAVGAAVQPTTAVQLSSVIGERFPKEDRKQALAQVLAGAEKSASTPEQISQILTETAVALKQAGVRTIGGQVSTVAGLAQFFPPEQTQKTVTLTRQLSRTLRAKDRFTSNALKKKGIDPDRASLGQVLGVWTDFINQGKTPDDRQAKGNELARLTGIPPRVFDGILSASEESFERVKSAAATAIEGADFKTIEAAATGIIQAPESRIAAAGVRERAGGAAVGAVPGSRGEAIRIFTELTGRVGTGTPEITENRRLTFAREMIGKSSVFDAALTTEESRKLFDLISVWTGDVRPALNIVAAAGAREHPLPETVQGRATVLIGKGNFLMGQAQEPQRLPGLTQTGFVARFEVHIADSIQFLRLVQAGGDIPAGIGTTDPGSVEGQFPPTTAAELSAAAGFAPAPNLPGGRVGAMGLPLDPSVGTGMVGPGPTVNISNQTNIINGADPATAITPNRGTGPGPGEPQ